MASGRYEYQSEFAKKYIAQGREKGLEEGLEKGREEGMVLAKAEVLLKILAGRGLVPSQAQRAHVLACTDRAVLDRWIDRAFQATSVEETIS